MGQQTVAKHKDAAISPQKVRLVADLIRGQKIDAALTTLTFSTKKASAIMKKVLDSAIANAENNNGADIDELFVSSVYVDEAQSIFRSKARAKGRGTRMTRRRCHITVIVEEKVEANV